MVQKAINASLAIGVVGDYADDSARREAGFVLTQNDSNPILIGNAVSYTDTDGIVQVGGENFAGIVVGPKQFANFYNLNPTLQVPNGITGGVCSFGHIFVQSATEFKPNYLAAYNTTTGAISAYEPSGSAPEGSTQIPNAKFILVSGDAGDTGILELGA